MIKNYIYIENKKQGFPSPPPLNTRKSKAPENCNWSFIEQIQDGLYDSAKLVRASPQKTSDRHFILRTSQTLVRSYRRNYTHRSVALYRTKKDGATRGNIEYMTGSFLEMDGSTDSTIKTQGDIFTLVREKNLPKPSYAIETSRGHFHVIWNYNRPLPWTNKGESYWTAQQKRLIELFRRAGFDVDKGASLNPCQNLRNPSQLQPFNFKRRCEVFIHTSYQKTSLRAIYRALNKTSIANPKRLPASVKLRRFLRANKTFEITHTEQAENLNMSLRTVKTQVSRAIQNGDLRIVRRTGNNGGPVRATQYESLIFIEKIPEVQHSINTNNSLPIEGLLRDFKQKGMQVGRRNRTIFALGLYLKARLGKRACIEAIRGELAKGARACHVPRKEFERTLNNVLKSNYTNPLSMSKLREWGLLQETMCNSKYHDIPLH